MNCLRLWRIERGLSQIELTLASGVPRYVIQLAENGVRELSNDQLEALAYTLGISTENLKGQKGEEMKIVSI